MMKKNNKIFVIIFLLILQIFSLKEIFSEDFPNKIIYYQNNQENKNNQKSEENKLPRNYKDFYLGMKLTDFINLIEKVDYLLYEGKIDVSLYEVDKNLFKASVPPYIRKLIFFFYKEILSLFTFYYDNKYVNFFSRYKSLCEKYGNPNQMDSERFIWEDESTIIILERTNILKVIDKNFINNIQNEYKNIENLIKISMDQAFDNF
ncbi:MAG: hypothetical protein N3A58_03850 [Spirochaetes bacterium]|nr:hypothetical protein [Spirochaetota bacterium]